jgi:purine-cytosine permease-like protein
MALLFLFIEIVLVAVLASKLATEAADKGFSKALFLFLTGVVWVGSRLAGNFIVAMFTRYSWLVLISGWITGLVGYMVFYYIISRQEDKYDFDTDDSWEKRNAASKNPDNETKTK